VNITYPLRIHSPFNPTRLVKLAAGL